MSNLGIDQVLAQIRALSAQAGAGLGTKSLSASGASGALGAAAAGSAAGASQPAFGAMLKQSIDAVNDSQRSADALATAWQRGEPGVDLAKVMIESQKASVSFRALTEVRNRLVSAYQDIMNMQI